MRILIFGTIYVDTPEKHRLAGQWVRLHSLLNPDCDLLLVDSASPMPLDFDAPRLHIMQLGDNIGHLARGGRDGWGRAFCAGLRCGMDEEYDYVVHIEGDSLCRLDVVDVCESMTLHYENVLSVPVRGTKRDEVNWTETGLMFFDAQWLKDSAFVDAYNWPDGANKRYPHTPEAVIQEILGDDLNFETWRVIRDDKQILVHDDVRMYDWITHATPEACDDFIGGLLANT